MSTFSPPDTDSDSQSTSWSIISAISSAFNPDTMLDLWTSPLASSPPPSPPDPENHPDPSLSVTPIELLPSSSHDQNPQHLSHENENTLIEAEEGVRNEFDCVSSEDTEMQWEPVLTPTPSPDAARFKRLHNEILRLREHKHALKAKYHELGDIINETQERLNKRETRRQDLKEITQELAVAQRFLTTADSISQAEVVRALEALNEEIFQLTSILADKVQVDTQQYLPGQADAEFRGQIPRWMLGKESFLDVVAPRKLEDSLAIQIGWQAILSGCCRWWIASWDYSDEDLSLMYEGIASEHDQAVAGRWRSLSLSVIHDPSSEVRESLLDDIIRPLVALPVICGYILTQQSYDELSNAFFERLPTLLDKCLKFRRTIGEGITSADVRTCIINSGEGYDFTKADLEYEDEKDGVPPSQKKGIVACSLGLGLFYDRAEVEVQGGEGNDQTVRTRRREVISKPKVILVDTLKEIIS